MSKRGASYWLRRWAKALRTTKAQQITGYTADGPARLCAWGVLHVDLINDGLFAWSEMDPWPVVTKPVAYGHVLDLIVGGACNDAGIGSQVVDWNDDECLTFAQIADRLDAEADRLDLEAGKRRDAQALLA
jgi:hypothetical protein